MAKAIQDDNRLYNFLCPLVQFATRCHYNGYVVRGVGNLPSDGAYIIAPCHQQALMEPLAVLRFAPKPPVFLARADIFAKPAIRAILTFLRILPVYRIRDGQEQLGRNRAIFDRCREVLIDGYPLCLMAEGRHNNRHHLLPMGKGMFRIAGETQQALGDCPLYIVPTGIDFDDYERRYSNVVVNIGKPIAVQPFMDEFRNNEPMALNGMRDALFGQLLPLMHDIRDEEHYDEIMTLCNVLNREVRRREGLGNNTWGRFVARQKIARQMDALASRGESATFSSLIGRSRRLRDLCMGLHLDERLVAEHWSLAATTLALLAVATVVAAAVALRPVRRVLLFCLLCYPLPLLPIQLVVRRVIADTQFRSSFDFGIRLILSILYAAIIGIVMACTGGGWMSGLAAIGAWWGVVAVAMVHLEARAAGPTIDFLRNIFNNCRYWLLRLARRGPMREINEAYAVLKAEFQPL